MTIFDVIRYPISILSAEEWHHLPKEIQEEITSKFYSLDYSRISHPDLVKLVRKVIAEYNTQ